MASVSDYTLADIEILAFCTALAEYRLDPSIIRDFVNAYGNQIPEAFEQARQEERAYRRKKKAQAIYLAFAARFLADLLDEGASDDIKARWLNFTRRTSLEKLSIAENCIFGSVAASV